jgi:hypothetical protein
MKQIQLEKWFESSLPWNFQICGFAEEKDEEMASSQKSR